MDIKNSIRQAQAFVSNRITRGWLLLLRRYYLHYKCRISLSINGVYLYCHKWDPDFEDRLKHNGIALTEEMYRPVKGPEVKRRMPLVNLSWLFFRIKETKKVCGIDGALFIYERDRRNVLFTINGRIQTEMTPDGTVLKLKTESSSDIEPYTKHNKREQAIEGVSTTPTKKRFTIGPGAFSDAQKEYAQTLELFKDML